MKWRYSEQAGGVDESKFCLFWVVFPVMCISSISPRFYFRRHAFCFLSVAAILEFLLKLFSDAESRYAAQADLKFMVLQPQPPKCSLVVFFVWHIGDIDENMINY
jgi:hypothetical protein